jgi:hypothetical protein
MTSERYQKGMVLYRDLCRRWAGRDGVAAKKGRRRRVGNRADFDVLRERIGLGVTMQACRPETSGGCCNNRRRKTPGKAPGGRAQRWDRNERDQVADSEASKG